MQDLPRQSGLRVNAVHPWLRRMVTRHYQLQFPVPAWSGGHAIQTEIY